MKQYRMSSKVRELDLNCLWHQPKKHVSHEFRSQGCSKRVRDPKRGVCIGLKDFFSADIFFFAFLGLNRHLEAKHRLLLLGKARLSLVHLKEIKIIFITINTGLSLLSSNCCHSLLSIIIIINTFVITTTIVIHMSINNH